MYYDILVSDKKSEKTIKYDSMCECSTDLMPEKNRNALQYLFLQNKTDELVFGDYTIKRIPKKHRS